MLSVTRPQTENSKPRACSHPTHSLVWRWCWLAAGCRLSYQPEHACMASTGRLGFLTAWWLDSKGTCPKREPGRSHIAFLTESQKPCHVTSTVKVYWSRWSQNFPRVKEREPHLLQWRSVRSYKKSMGVAGLSWEIATATAVSFIVTPIPTCIPTV